MPKKSATVPAANRDVQANDNTLITDDQLNYEHRALESRLIELETKTGAVPKINSDDESGPWQDIVSDIDTLGSDIESTRVEVKDPFERAVQRVNAVFFGWFAPRKGMTPGRLNIARARVTDQLADYMSRKEAAARAKREAEARKQRELEEAARLAARKAQEAREKAEREGRARAAANQAAKEAEAKAAASAAEARAFEAEQQAAAKPAELSRTRSGGGALASLKVEWDFKVDSYETLKGAALWSFVTAAAKDAAIRAFIKANAPEQLADDQEWQPLAGITMLRKRSFQQR